MQAFKHWPGGVAVAILLGAMVSLIHTARLRTGGQLIYPLDDTYIHMAIAKTFAQHGVWGVTPDRFTSSCSSPVWVGLLALVYRLVGANEVTPLLLSFLFAVLTVVIGYWLLYRLRLPAWGSFATILGVVLLTPLPVVALTGMEHVLHALLTVVFVYGAARALAGERDWRPLLILAPVLVAARYEGLFLVGIAAGLFLLRKKPVPAVAIGIAGALPVVVYGLILVSKGWFFLPNSILLKGKIPQGLIQTLGGTAVQQLIRAPHLAGLLAGVTVFAVCLVWKRKVFWQTPVLAATMCVAGSLAHLQFASTGWLYRYEAYLMVLGILVLGWTAGELLTRSRRWMALVLVVALAPATYRAGCAVGLVPQACKNLYEQQYQMGRFLHRYYQGATVAANDIGAINYLADIHCSDLMGLAHLEFARARHAQTYNTATIDELTRRDHVTIAIVFDSWFTRYGGLPASWLPVGKWEIPNCIWSEGAVVTFYATDAIEAGKLQAHLHEFAAELPKDVRRFAARPAGF